MSYAKNAERLETSAERLLTLLAQIRDAVQSGRNRYDDDAKVAVLATQAALASTDFWEALSVVHCDNHGIDPNTEEWNGYRTVRPNSPNETADDFAEWAKRVAMDTSYHPVPVVDLRHMLAAE